MARRLMAAGLLFLCSPTFGDVIGYWQFEEGSGTTAADQTGTYPGDLTSFYTLDGDTGPEGWSANVFASTVPQTGAANTGSIRMGGASAFVDLSNGQDMNLGTSFTVEFFMNPDQPVGSSPVFVLGGFSTTSLALTESLGVLYWNMGYNSEQPYTQAIGVQTGVWQHVALVKVPGQYSIYLDGTLVATDAVGTAGDGPYWFPGTDNTGDRTIGGNSGTFRGYLDEVRISDAALTPDQFLIVPEPGTLGLLALGGLAFLVSNRWCRRQKS